MAKARQIVFEAVLEFAAQKSISERIQLLEATAEIIGVPELTAELKAQAAQLRDAEQRFKEFRFKFSQGAK